MISKAKYIEVCLLRNTKSISLDAAVIEQAIKRYDEMVMKDTSGSHYKAMTVLTENYNRRMTSLKGYGNGVNPVWAKEEIESLRSIWDSFAVLRKITINSSEDKADIWHIGERP
jgi:hypothetical protein